MIYVLATKGNASTKTPIGGFLFEVSAIKLILFLLIPLTASCAAFYLLKTKETKDVFTGEGSKSQISD